MAIKNYSAAAETLIQLSGGKENFITVENCATRVRIQYKDLSKVDKKAIGEMDGVLSVIEKGRPAGGRRPGCLQQAVCGHQ